MKLYLRNQRSRARQRGRERQSERGEERGMHLKLHQVQRCPGFLAFPFLFLRNLDFTVRTDDRREKHSVRNAPALAGI